MTTPPIYLDCHATTAVDPRVVEKMLPYFSVHFGNASSESHAFGWMAKAAVEAARDQVAAFIGAATPAEIAFTAGATESNNIAILGTVEAAIKRRSAWPAPPHVITCATEHPSVLDACRHLASRGVRITTLPVNPDGQLDLDALRAAFTNETVLVTVMAANNEIGTLHDFASIGHMARERGVPFHTDATQAVGRVPLSVRESPIDLLSLSGHKIYGPKGVGALFVRKNLAPPPRPLHFGGGQEKRLRPGTLNVPGIVGLGLACDLCADERPTESARQRDLRDRLLAGLQSRLDAIVVNGTMRDRLPNNLNVSFAFTDGEALLARLTGIAISSGSACSSASLESSHVLQALGLPGSLAESAVRFGVGRFTTTAEIDRAVEHVAAVVSAVREFDPRYELFRTGAADMADLLAI